MLDGGVSNVAGFLFGSHEVAQICGSPLGQKVGLAMCNSAGSWVSFEFLAIGTGNWSRNARERY